MNEPNFNMNDRQGKSRDRKFAMLVLGLFLAGVVLYILADSSEKSYITLMAVGGVCRIAAIVLAMILIHRHIQRQGKGQIFKNRYFNDQQGKHRNRKFAMLALGLFLAGFVFNFLADSSERSYSSSIMLMAAGGVCWIAAIILALILIKRQGKEQIFKNRFQADAQGERQSIKISSRWIVVAAVAFALLWIASILMIALGR